jgi:DNA polymerase III subunit alpha, Gram-positive type
MENLNGKKGRFQILLQQINLAEDQYVPYFKNGEIERLIIEKKTRKWEFHFLLESILPYQVFLSFTTSLKSAFHDIADVSYIIQTRDKNISENSIKDYWKYIIGQIDGMSPALLSLLNEQVPKIAGNKIIVQARNEAERGALKKKYAPLIVNIYSQIGFPPLQFDVDHELKGYDATYQDFLIERQREDDERGKQALIDMQKRAEETNVATSEDDGPIVIGYQIQGDQDYRKLIEITEEERRIVVEGYIFACETKVLRSGRTLLEFKMTDYTNSILVKMFSKDNKEDGAKLNRVKKGMWVRVRGNVQNDTFVRDLVLMANDINEISGTVRIDKAPEGEKWTLLRLPGI